MKPRRFKVSPTFPRVAAPPRTAWRWAVLLTLLWPLLVTCARSAGTPRFTITTNYIIVTNIVLVTNYLTTAPVATTTVTPPKSSLPDLNWGPPADTFDWIQLKSGEWLKGSLKAMLDRELEFDSEELNDMTFDWKDIRQVRSPRTFSVLSVSGMTYSGPVHITPERVTVGNPNQTSFSRDQLQSFTASATRERNLWSGRVSLGLTLRAGNTEQAEYNSIIDLQRRTPLTRLSIDYIGNVSLAQGIKNANNHRVNVEFDRWLSQRFYLMLPALEYYRDPFQNLDHRLTAGLGVGYDLVDKPKLEWNITTGPAYQYAWFDSATPGEPTEKGAAALTLGTKLKWDITHRLTWRFSYRGQYTSQAVGETTHHADSTLSLEITKRSDLDVSLIWDRISQPKVGADGIEPEPDDFRLVVGLGLAF
jgi:putative salt-induced outer membrane protein YdiY